MEHVEIFGVEGEAVEGEDVFDGDVVDWVGHIGFIDGGDMGSWGGTLMRFVMSYDSVWRIEGTIRVEGNEGVCVLRW